MISLKIFVLATHWDSNKSQCRKTAPNWFKINALIEQAKQRADVIIYEHKLHNKPLAFADFDRLFKGDSLNTDCFYTFCTAEINQNKAMFSSETMRTYTTQISKLKQFKPKLTFADINHDFLKAYQSYMIESLGNMENTYFKSLSWIKSMLNRAIVKGIIKSNVFISYPLKKVAGHRQFLTIPELKQLEQIETCKLLPSERNVYNYFLFACYTGLRFTDLKNLRHNEIKNNSMIQLTMHKTKEVVTVPLSPQAKKLIGEGFDNQRVFRILTNQKSNDYLKSIIKKAEINKEISFHCARHTFATISIELGMPLEVTSKLLGHTDIKTTQIYARILETKKFKEMERWNTL